MSVINKMLRDLEQREEQNLATDFIPKQPNRPKQLLISAAVLVGLSSVATYGLLHIGAQQPAATPIESFNEEEYAAQEGDRVADTEVRTTEKVKTAEFETAKVQVTQVEEIVEKAAEKKATEKKANTEAQLVTVTDMRMLELQEKILSRFEMLEKQAVQRSIEKRAVTEDGKQMVALSPENSVPAQENQVVVAVSDGESGALSRIQQHARLALEQGRNETAITLLEQALAIDPSDIETRKQLASLQYATDRIASAFDTLQEGIALEPKDSSMRLMQARLLFRQGDSELASYILEAHPANAKATNDFLSFRAALSEQIGNYELALEDYTTLTRRQPENAKWWLGLAVSQDKMRLASDAMASYKQVKSLNQLPSNVHDFVNERIELLARQS